ncbi:hypothetical protein [Streptomyces sp. NPDC047525]|uniref:hypothetical protein n=1 Tax=Streptomyces sp. NPDC047525 TaxID=3155264 RepID=UPI0033E1EB5D
MEITGHSTDFIVDAGFPAAMKQFVMRQHRRWPGFFLDGAPVRAESLAAWSLPEADGDHDDADGYAGIVTFSAGQAMEDFWEENGYALDSAGEGPFSVFYRPHPQPPYAGRVESVKAYAVSLVTPEDPAADPFSRDVLADFTRAPAPDAPPAAAKRTPCRTRSASQGRTTPPPEAP